MGLGWSYYEAMNTPLSICALALRGRVRMLEGFGNYVVGVLLNGPPQKQGKAKPNNAASQVRSILDKMIDEGA
jgi:hypothetical protein